MGFFIRFWPESSSFGVSAGAKCTMELQCQPSLPMQDGVPGNATVPSLPEYPFRLELQGCLDCHWLRRESHSHSFCCLA